MAGFTSQSFSKSACSRSKLPNYRAPARGNVDGASRRPRSGLLPPVETVARGPIEQRVRTCIGACQHSAACSVLRRRRRCARPSSRLRTEYREGEGVAAVSKQCGGESSRRSIRPPATNEAVRGRPARARRSPRPPQLTYVPVRGDSESGPSRSRTKKINKQSGRVK